MLHRPTLVEEEVELIRRLRELMDEKMEEAQQHAGRHQDLNRLGRTHRFGSLLINGQVRFTPV